MVIRHDKPDTDYLVPRSRFSFMARVNGVAEGSLIGDKWVITAAHVARHMHPFNDRVAVGGVTYRAKKVLFHPEAKSFNFRRRIDMALVLLDRPVKGIAPIPLYSKSDETGQVASMVGAGMTGTGKTGMKVYDFKTRLARNRIESVTDQHITMRYDRDGLPNEGIPGDGDSGCPAFFVMNGKPILVGIDKKNEPADDGIVAGYGSEGVFVRISTQRKWILDTMAGKKAPDWGWTARMKSLPASPEATCVADFFRSFNAATREAADEFLRKWPSESSASAAERWKSRKALIDRLGPLIPKEYAVGPNRWHMAGATSAKGKPVLVDFSFAAGKPPKLIQVRVRG
jgi:hypothetical protein